MATIFIGIGGSGIETVTKIKEIYNRFEFTRVDTKKSKVIFAGIDVDKPKQSEKQSIEFIPVSVPNPREIIDLHWAKDSVFKKWWREGYYPETSLSPGNAAGRYRNNGRLLFWQNINSLTDGIKDLIKKAQNIDPDSSTNRNAHSIFLINSIAGGTGAGMFIDVGFLIRDIIHKEEEIKLYSFLFHGNIWEHSKIKDSNKVALGSLTQLERWMEQPDKFEMKYFDAKLPSKTNKFSALFDMVYIIDEKNLDGKQFVKKGRKSLIEQYLEFGSWLLFAFSLDDLSMEIQNMVSNLADLPKISPEGERARRFGSAAISVLTVPYEEITKWLKGAFVSSFENGFKDVSLDDPTIMLRQLKIDEQNQGEFSKVLRNSAGFGKLTDYMWNIAKHLGETDNMDIFNDNVSSYKLRELTDINERFSSWKKEIDGILLEKISEFRKQLKESVIKEMEESLNLKGISKYLSNLILKLELQKAEILKIYTVRKSSSDISEIMKSIIDEISKLPSNQVKFMFKKAKFKSFIDEWLAYSGFNNYDNKNTYINAYMGEMLTELLTNFYDTLMAIARTNAELINLVNEIYSKLIKEYEENKVSYHHDKSNILDVAKLKNNDFPLLISIPVDREDLSQVHKELMEDSTLIDSFRNSLWTGMNIENRSLVGLSSFYDRLYEDNAETQGINKDAIISTAFEHLKEITKYKLDRSFKEQINKNFRIDKALKSHFGKKYQEYQSLLSLPEGKSRFLTEFIYQVGEDTIGGLQNEKIDRTEWINLAIKGFFNKLALSINPFWSIKKAIFEAFYYKSRLNKYSPNEKPAIFVNKKLELPLQDFENIHDLESDQFRIFMFTYTHGCPLYLLDCVRDTDFILYSDPKESVCAFNDERFLNEWKDNIEHKSRFEFNDFLFIMALGFNIIHRTQKGKAKSKSFYYGTKNLGTITDAMYKIRDKYADQIKEEVKIKLNEDIFIPRVSAEDIIIKYNTLLAEVDKQLSSIEPPKSSGNMTAHNIWKHLKDQVNVKRDSKGNIIKYEGSFYRNTKEDIGTLLKEYTGLVLF